MPTENGARVDVRKTYKLYVGGAFPRSESGRSYVVNDSKGRFLANASSASRKDARDAVQAARKAFGRLVRPDAVQPGAGGLPRRRGAREQARAVRRGGAALRGSDEEAVRGGRRALRRPAGLVRRLGGQDRAGRRRIEPGRRAVLQLLAARADRRRRGRRAAAVVAARSRERGGARHRHRQHGRRRHLSRASAARGHAVGGARHVRRARRRRQHPHRLGVRHRHRPSPRTST